MLASYQEIVTGAIHGAYTKATPPDGPPRVLTDGKPGSKLFSTPEAQARYVWTRSLAYYEPWDGMDLGTMLRSVPGRVHVIVGLKDRTGMVTGGEWRRLLANAPKTTNVCVDPQLGHETPNGSETALRCFEQAVLAPNERI